MLYKSRPWSPIFWGPSAALPSGYFFALDLLVGTVHSQVWTAACLDSGYHGYRSPDCSIPVLLSILMGGFKFHIAHGEQWAGNAGNDVTESMGKLCKHIWGYFPGWPAPADQWSKAVQMLRMVKSPTLLGWTQWLFPWSIESLGADEMLTLTKGCLLVEYHITCLPYICSLNQLPLPIFSLRDPQFSREKLAFRISLMALTTISKWLCILASWETVRHLRGQKLCIYCTLTHIPIPATLDHWTEGWEGTVFHNTCH